MDDGGKLRPPEDLAYSLWPDVKTDANGVNAGCGYHILRTDYTPGALRSASESYQYAVSFPSLPGQGVACDRPSS